MSEVVTQSPRVGFVSLGCPKALVDSERILTQLRVEGYDIVGGYAEADLVVVNTCGFIDAAVEESLDAIGEALNENGKVVVTGCLGAKPESIYAAHPDVLAVTGPQKYEEVLAVVHEHLPPQHDPYMDLLPLGGLKLTPRHYAYLKISEGCNHKCRFCIIPSMRGNLASRPVGDVLREAEGLVSAGWSSRRTPARTAPTSDTSLIFGGARWSARMYRISLVLWAAWMPGSVCTTCIPIRT